MSKMIGEEFPWIKIVVGGIHPTIFANEILRNCSSIDYIVLGEGEKSILSLVEFLEGKIEKFPSNGFAFRLSNKICIYPQTQYIEDLDSVPFPAYELTVFDNYKGDLSKWHNPKNLKFDMTVPIITSRSCPYGCNFCSLFLVIVKKFRY